MDFLGPSVCVSWGCGPRVHFPWSLQQGLMRYPRSPQLAMEVPSLKQTVWDSGLGVSGQRYFGMQRLRLSPALTVAGL